jgi:hypothetical protein
MILAYIAWPPDDGTHMWADPKTRGTPPPGVICEVCDQRIDYNAVNPNYKAPRSYYDLSRAFDGDFLVSPKLRSYLEDQALSGLRFVDIPSSRRYFILQCANVLELVRPATLELEEYCGACGQYKSVAGIMQEEIEGVRQPIREGIYFSDLKVGYGPQMGPELIVGVDTWHGMVARKFKGLGNGKPIIR